MMETRRLVSGWAPWDVAKGGDRGQKREIQAEGTFMMRRSTADRILASESPGGQERPGPRMGLGLGATQGIVRRSGGGNMKRTWFVLLALLLVVSMVMAACGPDATEPPPEEPEVAEPAAHRCAG